LEPGVEATPDPPPATAPPPSIGLTEKEPARAETSGSAVGWFVGAGALLAGTAAGVIWWRNRSGEYDRCQEVLDQMVPGRTCDNLDKVGSEKNLALGVSIGLAAGATALGIVGIASLSKSGAPPSNAATKATSATRSVTAFACAPETGGMGC